MRKPSAKSLIGALLIALLISISQPVTAALVLPFCLVPVLISVLYAWAGWIPAAAASGGTVAMLLFQGSAFGSSSGLALAAAGAVILVLPACVACVTLKKNLPFFRRMMISVLTQTAALLACLCVVYLGYKIDLVDALVDLLGTTIRWMPDEALMMLLQNLSMSGMLNQEAIDLLSGGFVTGEQLTVIFSQAFDTMRYMYKQTMPAMVLNSGLLTGVLMTTVPGLICRKRGDNIEYRPMCEWFLPSRAITGLTVCMITSYVLQWQKVSGAEAVTMVIGTVGGTMLVMQGVGSLSRSLRRNGMRRGGRIAMITAGLVFAYTFVEIVGAMSALFGSRGTFSGWMRKKMEEQRKEDDEE